MMPSTQWSHCLLYICLLTTSIHFTQADRWSRASATAIRTQSRQAASATTSAKPPPPSSSSPAIEVTDQASQDAPAPATEALTDFINTNELLDASSASSSIEDLDVPTLEECETDNIGYEIVTGWVLSAFHAHNYY